MSVVVITPIQFDTVSELLRHLKTQSIQHELEVVVVAPAADVIPLDAPELQGFHDVQVVPFADILGSPAAARVAGVRAALGPVVAFVEDHSFPQPEWAEALVAAYHGPWAAVGPAVGNANPDSAFSWANLLIEYAPWLDPAISEAVEHLPGHNSSYRREVLIEYGDALEAMLQAESVLHWDLRARGFQLRLEPAAKTLHVNYTRALASMRLRFHGGRIFASARAHNWPRTRRLAYCAAAPIIPAVRLRRILAQTRGHHRARLPGTTFPILLMLLLCDAAGEMAGYLLGTGREAERAGKFEFRADRQRPHSERYERAGS